MKQERKYLVFLLAAVVLYLVVKLLSPREYDWTVTLHKEDKNPFGTFALYQLLPAMFAGHDIHYSARTIYELYDTLQVPLNLISLGTTMNPGEEDVVALLQNVERGGQAFLSAHYFEGVLADTFDLSTDDHYFSAQFSVTSAVEDTCRLLLKNPPADSTTGFLYPRNSTRMYFSAFDSTNTTVMAVNDMNLPVTLRVAWGQGSVILNSTPLAFTNAYLLAGSNAGFAEGTLSALEPRPVFWTEFYHLGRLEPTTPLRFVLSSPPLKWAYYLTLGGIVVFMFMEAKRKQRIIPVIKPLANTSLEFVTTMGNLYYQSGDHKNIALKKISFLLEHIRSAHGLSTQKINTAFYIALSKRSGKPEEEIRALFKRIADIQAAEKVSDDALTGLNKSIENFLHKSAKH